MGTPAHLHQVGQECPTCIFNGIAVLVPTKLHLMYAQAADNDLAGFGELAGAQEATEKTEISVNSCATWREGYPFPFVSLILLQS